VPLLTGPQEVSLAKRIEQGLLASGQIAAANGGLAPTTRTGSAPSSSTGTGPSGS